MDIQELNKTQLILLTLLITFVVSIATGIVTVSLMQQAPKSLPASINNVIERTIEKVTTVPASGTNAAPATDTKGVLSGLGEGDVVVSIYPNNTTPAVTSTTASTATSVTTTAPAPTPDTKALGQGIIISDVGLILADSSILTSGQNYTVMLNTTAFEATIVKQFSNGFTILKISPKGSDTKSTATTPGATPSTASSANGASTAAVDNNH